MNYQLILSLNKRAGNNLIRLQEREKKFIIVGTLIIAVSLFYVLIADPFIAA